MSRLTQQELVDSIVGLQGIARDLRQASQDATSRGVLVDPQGMMEAADYLMRVSNELQSLITIRPVPPIPE